MRIFSALATWISYGLLSLDSASRFGAAVHFFIEDVTKILVLLVVMIYAVSFLRAGLDTDRVRSFLVGRRRVTGYLAAAAFGAVTPFCSCSSIPLFLAFTSARIPLGITMSFLITSPMINEVAVVLLGAVLGPRFLVFYLTIGFAAGILGGAFFDLVGAERYLTPLGLKARAITPSNADGGSERSLRASDRHQFAVGEVRTIYSRVWKWVLLGVGLGAALHGYVPDGVLGTVLSGGKWWSVPAAVGIGIPLYANASGVIPVAESLLAKGMPVGTTMAFMMSVVAASFPEMVLLKQVMRPRLLLTFVGILLMFFTLAGWLLNALM